MFGRCISDTKKSKYLNLCFFYPVTLVTLTSQAERFTTTTFNSKTSYRQHKTLKSPEFCLPTTSPLITAITLMFSTVRLSGLTIWGMSCSQLQAVVWRVLIQAGWASAVDEVRSFFSVS